MTADFYFIDQKFYLMHQNDLKILDINNVSKQGHRSHICVRFVYRSNTFYLPLRKNLSPDVRSFGRIGHSVPSKSMPRAGIDFRNALLINDPKLVHLQKNPAVAFSQYKQICRDYRKICNEFENYLLGFVSDYRRGPHEVRYLYKDSTLFYFLNELGLEST